MNSNPKIIRFVIFAVASLLLLTQCQQDSKPQPNDPTLLYVEQFQAALESMFPTQTFGFDINEGEVETISLWPPSDTDEVIVTYYIHNEQNPELVTGQGFFAQCYLNDHPFRTFLNQKVGTCRMKLNTRPTMIDLKFKSETSTTMTVYLNYEYKKLQIETKSTLSKEQQSSNLPKPEQESKKKLSQVSQTFEKVRVNSENQQTLLRTVLKGMSKQGRRLQGNIKYAHHRIVTETVFVILSGLFGMWILKKQLNKGYQLLV